MEPPSCLFIERNFTYLYVLKLIQKPVNAKGILSGTVIKFVLIYPKTPYGDILGFYSREKAEIQMETF